MNEGLVWIKSVLEVLQSQFPDDIPIVALPSDKDKVSILAFSFKNKGEWYGFGVTEKDFSELSPNDLVEQVKKDLKL
jgi:hypothetical protein